VFIVNELIQHPTNKQKEKNKHRDLKYANKNWDLWSTTTARARACAEGAFTAIYFNSLCTTGGPRILSMVGQNITKITGIVKNIKTHGNIIYAFHTRKHKRIQKLENVAINDVLPLKVACRDVP